MRQFEYTINDFSGGVQIWSDASQMKGNESLKSLGYSGGKPGVLESIRDQYEVIEDIVSITGSPPFPTLSGGVGRIGSYDTLTQTFLVCTSNTQFAVATGFGGSSAPYWNVIATGYGGATSFTSAHADNEDRVYYGRAHSADLSFYNGSAMATVANYRAYYVAYYRDRIFLANVQISGTTRTNRVVFSDLGVDTFSANSYIDVDTAITGMRVVGDFLIIFTRARVYYYDNYSLRILGAVQGTDQSTSIQVIDDTVFWANAKGVYKWNSTSGSKLISYPVGLVDMHTNLLGGWSGDIYSGLSPTKSYLIGIGSTVYMYDTLTDGWSTVDYTIGERCEGVQMYLNYGTFDNPQRGNVYLNSLSTGVLASGLSTIYSDSREWISGAIDIDQPSKKKNYTKVVVRHSGSGNAALSFALDRGGSYSTPVTFSLSTGLSKFDLPRAQGNELYIKLTKSDTSDMKVFDITVYGNIVDTKQGY